MKTSIWMSILSLIPLLAGCPEAPHAMDPLVMPPASEIEEISVTRWKPEGQPHQNEVKIYDRQKIEEILAELQSNNTGYLSAMEDRAPQEYSIALDTRDIMATMFWVGPDWLGGVDDQHKDEKGTLISHYRKLDGEQHTKLLNLLRQAGAE